VVLTEGQEAPRPAGHGSTSPRSDQSGSEPQGIETDVSCKNTDGVVAPSDKREAPMRHARDTGNTAIAHFHSPEITDSNDGRAVDDGNHKHPPTSCLTSSLRMTMALLTKADH